MLLKIHNKSLIFAEKAEKEKFRETVSRKELINIQKHRVKLVLKKVVYVEFGMKRVSVMID